MQRPRRVATKAVQYEEINEDEEADVMDQSESEAELTSTSFDPDGDDEEYEFESNHSPKVFQVSTTHNCKPLYIMIRDACYRHNLVLIL